MVIRRERDPSNNKFNGKHYIFYPYNIFNYIGLDYIAINFQYKFSRPLLLNYNLPSNYLKALQFIWSLYLGLNHKYHWAIDYFCIDVQKDEKLESSFLKFLKIFLSAYRSIKLKIFLWVSFKVSYF